VQKTIREIKTAIAFPKWSLWVKKEKGKKKKGKKRFYKALQLFYAKNHSKKQLILEK